MVLLTQSGGFLGPIAKVLGWIFNELFVLTNNFGIQNIGLAIILFTIVVKLLMLPLTIKQLKFSKLSSIMNPELMAVQKKYSGKTDQDSVAKMQAEQKAVYEKYGTSPTGGCLQLIIQMPILFALYRVIQNIPAYVDSVRVLFTNMTDVLMQQENFTAVFAENFASGTSVDTVNQVIDVMNHFSVEQWSQLKELFPTCAAVITQNVDALFEMYDFFGINLSIAPTLTSISIIIPILTVLTQWISMKTIGNNNVAMDSDNPAAQSMKTMNTIMPLMTGFIAMSLPNGLGLYWIATAVCQTVQQVVLNLYFDQMDMDEMVRQNVEKANAKREKQGLPPQTISTKANANSISKAKSETTAKLQSKLEETRQKNLDKVEEIKKSSGYSSDSSSKGGSLAAKANMVAKFNEKNN